VKTFDDYADVETQYRHWTEGQNWQNYFNVVLSNITFFYFCSFSVVIYLKSTLHVVVNF